MIEQPRKLKIGLYTLQGKVSVWDENNPSRVRAEFDSIDEPARLLLAGRGLLHAAKSALFKLTDGAKGELTHEAPHTEKTVELLEKMIAVAEGKA